MMADIAGRPLIAHTLDAVIDTVDVVVVATRPDLVDRVEDLGVDVIVTTGGSTRTDSELAGLTALGREYDLIGIHDAARPMVRPGLVELLYETAEESGGAVPVLEPDRILFGRRSLTPVAGAVTVQTPQVFRGPELLAAYVRAANTGFEGHDTIDVIQRFGELEIVAVEGDPGNIKVTFPADLETVRSSLEGLSRTEPR